ncbi:MAG: adenylate/guanylate cyclase domain-containing protein, partial [Microvirga sp.]
MDGTYATSLLSEVTEAGLAGIGEPELLRMFCVGLNAERVPVARAMVMIDTLHPVHEGHVFRWQRGENEVKPGTE